MADNPSEKKISETSGVKAVLDEAAERIEATWREKLLAPYSALPWTSPVT